MGYSIELESDGETDVFSLATTAGLAALGRWVDALPAPEYSLLRCLLNAGVVRDTEGLAIELQRALALRPPADPDVASTAANLLDRIGTGDRTETASILP